MTAPARKHQDEPHPFFVGTSFSVSQLAADIRDLEIISKSLTSAHAAGSATSMKLASERMAKLSGQIQSLSSHLASVSVRHINRRGRA